MEAIATGSLYAVRREEDPPSSGVSDTSWRELAMDDVFARIDRTATTIGQQTLYRRVRLANDDARQVAVLDRRIRAFGEDAELRAAFASAVESLSTERALAGLCWRAADLTRMDALGVIERLVAAGSRVAALECRALRTDLEALRLAVDVATAWKRSLVKETTATLLGFVKVAFRLDVDGFVLARELAEGRPALRRIVEIVGELDAAQSIASFRASSEAWSVPAIGRRGAPIVLTGMRDLLVDGAPPHDVFFVLENSTLDERTPWKTVAVQSILAQSIATTTCEGYAAPFVTEVDFATCCPGRVYLPAS